MAHRNRDLFLIQNGKCFYCGKFISPFTFDKDSNPGGYTRDHLYPKSQPVPIPQNSNAVLACCSCNTKKGNKPPTKEQVKKFNRLLQLTSMV